MGGNSSKPKNCVPGECLQKAIFGSPKCSNCYQPNAENYDYGGEGYPSKSKSGYYGLSVFFVIVLLAIVWVMYNRKKTATV